MFKQHHFASIYFRLSALCLMVFVLVLPAKAQFTEQTAVTVEGGPSFFNLNALNDKLEASKYAALPNSFFAMGFSANRLKNRMLLGASMYNFVSADRTVDNRISMVRQHYLIPRLGGVIVQEDEWQMFAAVGAGAGIANLRLKPDNSQQFTDYWSSGVLLEALVTAQITKPLPSDLGKNYVVVTGLSAGYIYALGNGYQFSKYNAGAEGPTVSPAGFYLRLTFGMGGRKLPAY